MIKEYFQFEKYNTDFKTEVIAGLTTFLASMYIIVVNPSILSSAGMPFEGVLTATILVSAFSSIMMGIYAKNPILIAPGMGINAFFAYSIVLGMGIRWEVALGTVFWSGIIFLVLSILNIRTLILKSIPKQIRFGISAGIGLFITFIGFVNAKFIVSNPATIIGIGKLDAAVITFLIGLIITSILVIKKVKGALILGIVITTFLSIPIGRIYGDAFASFGTSTLISWKGLFANPDFSLIFKLDLIESIKFSLFPVIFAFLFTDMFDSIATFIGVAEAGNLLDENGEPLRIKESLIVDAFSTTISGLFGTSSGTSYIESAAGVEEGGKTGLTAVIAGLLFLPFMFFSPLISIVPPIATAPALILVGVFMMKPITKINWNNFDDSIPAFLGMILIPLTNSITQGIIWSFLSWTLIKIFIGKKVEVSLMLIIIDLFAILALVV
ncbi:NCS2 family permease [Ignavibacteria bacterium 4148-Me]|uniref:NCS2 family permease n=1 Tax=Rosettibacter primus TaxID=3111523 RepID=UPI00336C30BB